MQIPPSVEVYEYITFKGDDIKDLEIRESGGPAAAAAAAQQQPQYGYAQPQYGYGYAQPQYGYAGYPPQQYGMPQQGYAGYPPQYGMPQYGATAPVWGQQAPEQPPAPISVPPAQPPQPVPEKPVAAPAPAPPKNPWGNPNAPKPETEGVILPAARNPAPAGGVAKTAATVPAPKAPAPKPKPTSFAAAALNALAPEELAKLKAQPKSITPQVGGGRGVPAPRAGGRGPAPVPRGAAPVVPKEAFDFQKMLKMFNKEKLAQSTEAKKLSESVQANPVYVKDDFFDTMSSEATEKAAEKHNRARFHEQRKMDALTFGFDAVSANQAAHRTAPIGGRDGGRGRGGRDGGRNGGGRGGRGGRS